MKNGIKTSTDLNIWQELSMQGPILALAPMDDVTDLVFRQLIQELAPADLYFTEFANADGFVSPGRSAIEKRLAISDAEGPVIAQIWGTRPENFKIMAEELSARQFVGIDLNMGCPVKDIVKKGACSALIQNRQLAQEIITATQAGAGKLPVSVKTRLGDKAVDWDWLEFLLKSNLAALSIHLRTVKELSKVPAHWEIMPEIVALRDRIAPDTILLGNGDINSRQEAIDLMEASGCDGVMVGRGIFHNPWIFADDDSEKSNLKRIDTLTRHLEIWEKWIEPTDQPRRFEPLKRFFKVYINEFAGAAQLRAKLMACHDLDQVRVILINEKTRIQAKA